ncbi:MAG: hypothetical protein EOO73_19110 [Myxococcales bacterium]|nr:MAG: hypothetical protein EOO73_19110 [Myxococcales bacterium]
MSSNLRLWWLACAIGCAACDERVCADQEPRTHSLPAKLSQTGLFSDVASERLETGVFSYAPEFALWSDGASKRRFIALPHGSRIDSHDASDWAFPEGTKLWKEFSQGDEHLETRLLQKTGPGAGDWAAAAYVWRADQSDAELAPYGAVNVLATTHDVPASGECFGCHDGRPGRVLGFSAVQLAARSYDAPERLSDAAREALLSDPLPRLDVPGSARERAAIGYLHANCSHCHNQSTTALAGSKCFNPNDRLSFQLDFSLPTQELSSVESTPAYRTALGEVVERGNPDASKVVELMSKRSGGLNQMPPLGTDKVDERGLALIREWIGSL